MHFAIFVSFAGFLLQVAAPARTVRENGVVGFETWSSGEYHIYHFVAHLREERSAGSAALQGGEPGTATFRAAPADA